MSLPLEAISLDQHLHESNTGNNPLTHRIIDGTLSTCYAMGESLVKGYGMFTCIRNTYNFFIPPDKINACIQFPQLCLNDPGSKYTYTIDPFQDSLIWNIPILSALSIPARVISSNYIPQLLSSTNNSYLRQIPTELAMSVSSSIISAVACNALGYPIDLSTLAYYQILELSSTVTFAAFSKGFDYLSHKEEPKENNELEDRNISQIALTSIPTNDYSLRNIFCKSSILAMKVTGATFINFSKNILLLVARDLSLVDFKITQPFLLKLVEFCCDYFTNPSNDFIQYLWLKTSRSPNVMDVDSDVDIKLFRLFIKTTVEEIVFREFVQRRILPTVSKILPRRCGDVLNHKISRVFLSSALFALAHHSTALTSPLGVMPQFLSGLVWGGIVERENSLMIPIMGHFLIDVIYKAHIFVERR